MAKSPIPADPKDFASLLVRAAKISPSYASELANEKRSPSLKLAVQLENACGIPARYWIERGAA